MIRFLSARGKILVGLLPVILGGLLFGSSLIWKRVHAQSAPKEVILSSDQSAPVAIISVQIAELESQVSALKESRKRICQPIADNAGIGGSWELGKKASGEWYLKEFKEPAR